MIDFYYWPTSNGRKVAIMFEETGIEFRLVPTDITRGAQFEPEFLALNPNNKVPVIVDADGPDGVPLALFESGAILEYLAHKSGRFMPAGERNHWIAKQWLMFQMGTIGPLWGQHGHFSHYSPQKVPYAIERYLKEILRQLDVMNYRLKTVPYLAGNEYTIADIASYPWVITYERRDIDIGAYPHVAQWLETVGAREAVQRGMALMTEDDRRDKPDANFLDNYFGEAQHQRRS